MKIEKVEPFLPPPKGVHVTQQLDPIKGTWQTKIGSDRVHMEDTNWFELCHVAYDFSNDVAVQGS